MGIDELLARHEAGGAAAVARGEGLSAVPALHTVLLTCMDCRIDAYSAFGLAPGEVHVLRNAGGVVTDDVVRSLTISQRKLQTREVLLVRHAGCGLTSFTEEDFAEELAEDTGMQPPCSATRWSACAATWRCCAATRSCGRAPRSAASCSTCTTATCRRSTPLPDRR